MESMALNGLCLQGYNIKEICKILNIPYSMYHHARNRIGNKIDAIEYCIKRKNLALFRTRYRTEYDRFMSIKNRTTNKNDRDYKRLYHKVGICPEWEGPFGFLNFIYTVGPMPNYEKVNGRNKWTIDRIDNNGNYSPENCRWATMKEQGRNKSDNVFVDINGEHLVQSEACEKYGIPTNVFWNRVHCYHWPIEKALKTPIRGRRRDERV